jgi:hypothetical protein
LIAERSGKQPQEHENQWCKYGELHQGDPNEIAGLQACDFEKERHPKWVDQIG